MVRLTHLGFPLALAPARPFASSNFSVAQSREEITPTLLECRPERARPGRRKPRTGQSRSERTWGGPGVRVNRTGKPGGSRVGVDGAYGKAEDIDSVFT